MELEKANKIVNYHKEKLGLREKYEIEIREKQDGCVNPQSKKIIFDKKYFENLTDSEFSATILHEFGHNKINLTKKSFVYLAVVVYLSYYILKSFSNMRIEYVISLVFVLVYLSAIKIHRDDEFKADKFACDFRDKFEYEDLISAIDKANCRYFSLLGLLKKIIPHPSKEERFKRIESYKKQ